ncbi:MAG: helix-turn-helix domain-containing protein, partial [Desulfobacterales bacterium]|nr:helix-turn-helix domain-containing protein [Desulfobacterales bacterium]
HVFYGLATTALIGRHLITGQRAPMPQPTETAPKNPPPRPYALSHLKGLAPESIAQTLHSLMEKDRLYTREDLTQQELAEQLGISPHQLSQILTQHMGTRFYTLVNHYRIKEAKTLLLAQPDLKILSIAHTVGFNTPSAFYRAFKKETQLSPGQFKARANAGEAP